MGIAGVVVAGLGIVGWQRLGPPHHVAMPSRLDVGARFDPEDGKSASGGSSTSATLAERAPPTAAPNPGDAVVPRPSAPEPSVARPPISLADAHDHYEGVFVAERTDTSWANDARRTASQKLGAALPAGSRAVSIECRESMCRIETAHASLLAYRQFVTSAFLTPETKLWNGGVFTLPVKEDAESHGEMLSVSFIARDGQSIPPMEAGE